MAVGAVGNRRRMPRMASRALYVAQMALMRIGLPLLGSLLSQSVRFMALHALLVDFRFRIAHLVGGVAHLTGQSLLPVCPRQKRRLVTLRIGFRDIGRKCLSTRCHSEAENNRAREQRQLFVLHISLLSGLFLKTEFPIRNSVFQRRCSSNRFSLIQAA